MVDFHTHILPGMDDGAPTVADSLAMLARLHDQGVDTVCLTSHFLKEEPSVENFLRRRSAAWDALRAALPEKHPRLLLGAEVQYRPGLDEMPGLHQLCLQHTNVLLLEMLFHPWRREETDTVFRLAESGAYTVMLAHVERYMPLQRPSVWQQLADRGVVFQSNAEIFILPALRGVALTMLRSGYIHVLGTDTHDLRLRAPRMDAALDLIAREMGEGFRRAMAQRSDDCLAMWTI